MATRICAPVEPTVNLNHIDISSPDPPVHDGLQTKEEERLQFLNQEIQDSREELAALIEAEDDWDIYERPRVKHKIIVLEDERSELVRAFNASVRKQLAAAPIAARRAAFAQQEQQSPIRNVRGSKLERAGKSHRKCRPISVRNIRAYSRRNRSGRRRRSGRRGLAYVLRAVLARTLGRMLR